MEHPFTEEYFVQFIREELAPSYYQYPAVRGMFELDDLVQDTVMWYYSPMKSGKQRLKHYLDEYGNGSKHFWNSVRFGVRQAVPALMRYNFMKNIPLSLNVPLDFDADSSEFMDLVPDLTESIFDRVQCQDTLDQIKHTLREENIKRFYKEAMKDKQDITYMEFRLYPMTIIRAGSRTAEQSSIISDLMSGYKLTELRNKYSDFDKKLAEIRAAFTLYYEGHQTTVKEILGVRKAA